MALWLLRHGHTDWNGPPKRLQGRADPGLSMWGRADAASWGESVPEPACVVTSPARRCLETVAAAFPTSPAFVIEEERLWEMDNGVLAGLLESEAARRFPEEWARWRERPSTVRLGGGETLAEVLARFEAALDELDGAIESPRLTLVVTHGGPLRALICRAAGLPLDDVHAITVDNLATFAVERGPRGRVLKPVAVPSLALAC
jgi:broad specificity phosphatase PhoE